MDGSKISKKIKRQAESPDQQQQQQHQVPSYATKKKNKQVKTFLESCCRQKHCPIICLFLSLIPFFLSLSLCLVLSRRRSSSVSQSSVVVIASSTTACAVVPLPRGRLTASIHPTAPKQPLINREAGQQKKEKG
ncbi:uncharacterized protein K452DRAFT_134776 [Aplosporella prunicola CBS 121167]|uniref:Uncharacterized protein n=1 Tax=Aplosporella prunicola CBS 121167 TaxID=1176127 RepID=A0A6A6BLV8_9PEZI|nr:uncharacterized protein K452DRAFT_134776 [Aplosporella prunicola CBS 121167]KAF2145120.1 hypothetical protein K452DRAFT_134776 [Aplosporella prunicola CBS 121167]